ncbi:MAG: hypothetical protein AAFP76_05125 [Bacteroidota bacterium]
MKIFSKLRKQLIPGKNLRKYLIYALGEIILVVIGILIALGFNSRNQKKQALLKVEKTAELVLNQMIADTIEMTEVMLALRESDSIAKVILLETPYDQPLPLCSECPGFITDATISTISSKAQDIISREPLETSEITQILYQIEADYKENVSNIQLYHQPILDVVFQNYKYLQSNYAWFARYITELKCGDECWKYFSESSDFRNRAALINSFAYQTYPEELQEFKEIIRLRIQELNNALTQHKAK